MTISPAPITQQVLDQNGLPTLPWLLFFNQTFTGDSGTAWNPVFTSLTGSTTSVTGRYYRLSQYLACFVINVVPNGNTSAVAGTTYIGNFPLKFRGNGFNTVVSGTTGGSIGINAQSDNRIYVPVWTNVSVPLTIIGMGEAA